MQLDLKNAYGSIYRHFGLRAVSEQLPEMGPMLSAEWGHNRSRAWIRGRHGWEQLAVNRGAWQGSPHSNVAFCCALTRATSNAQVAWEDDIAGGQYADDSFLHGPAGTMATDWQDLKEMLHEAGVILQDSKSMAYTPGEAELTEEQRRDLARLHEIVPRATEPPRVLGTVAERMRCGLSPIQEQEDEVLGELERILLGQEATDADASDPRQTTSDGRLAEERAAEATKVCNAIKELATADIHGPTLAAGWAILSKSAARALDFDARLTPSPDLAAAQATLRADLHEVAEALLGTSLSERAMGQLSSPGPLGGCGLRTPDMLAADAAFFSSWATTKHAVQEHARAMGRPLDHIPDAQHAEAAQQRLHDQGIAVHEDGRTALTRRGQERMELATWIQEDNQQLGTAQSEEAGSTVRLLGRILRLLEQLRAAKRYSEASDPQKATLHAAAGPGVGSTWTAPPDGTLLPNAHWRVATQLRLGCMEIPAGCVCNLETKEGHSCQQAIDAQGIHPQLCARGPARMRTHRGIQTTLGSQLRHVGACVDYERTIPELCEWLEDGTCKEAIVDAAVRFPTSLHTTVIDVTIRSPHASRYASNTTTTVTTAEAEKRQRYGSTITPVVYTPYGRLGPRGMQGLEQLAADARWHNDTFDQQRGLVARWRLALERSLVHSVADTLLLAMGAAAAAGWQRHAGTAVGRHQARSAARTSAGGTREGPLTLTDEQRQQCEEARARALDRHAALAREQELAGSREGPRTLTDEQHHQCAVARAQALEHRADLARAQELADDELNGFAFSQG